MKYFIAVLLCAFLATVLAVPAVDKEKIKESLRKVKQAHDDCNADPATHIDLEALKQRHEAGTEVPNLSAHAFCVSKKLGWQNADGSVNEAHIRARANTLYGDKSNLEEIIAECVQAQGSPEATAKHLFDCYRKHTPRPSGTHPRPDH